MTGWVILVDQPRDLPNAETPHKVITTAEYLARPRLFEVGRPKLVKLLALLRLPVEGLLCLAARRGARSPRCADRRDHARAARAETLRARAAGPRGGAEPLRPARRRSAGGGIQAAGLFRLARDSRFEAFGRLLFEMFRCPALEVTVEPGNWLSIDRIRPRNITRLANGEAEFFRESLHNHTRREWRDPKVTLHRQVRSGDPLPSQREDRAVLPVFDPAFRPHRRQAFGRRRADHQASQLSELAEYRRPVHPRDHFDRQLHLPASPAAPGRKACRSSTSSSISTGPRCTNKVFLMERYAAESGADAADRDPRRGHRSRPKPIDELGLPLVVKIPDGSFSRGVHKIELPPSSQRVCERTVRGDRSRCWRRNFCRPSSIGGSACLPASRCSSARTAWRAAIGRW